MGLPAKNARAFSPRSPRFVLQATDSQTLLYSRPGHKDAICETQVVDLSVTGVAFFTTAEHAPEVGELVDLDLQILDIRPSLVRKARVVRLESVTDNPKFQIRVAVQFL